MQFSAERSEDGTVGQIWVDHFDDEVLIALAWQQWQSPTWPLPPRERGYGEARAYPRGVEPC